MSGRFGNCTIGKRCGNPSSVRCLNASQKLSRHAFLGRSGPRSDPSSSGSTVRSAPAVLPHQLHGIVRSGACLTVTSSGRMTTPTRRLAPFSNAPAVPGQYSRPLLGEAEPRGNTAMDLGAGHRSAAAAQ
jgi:hypothetical protein